MHATSGTSRQITPVAVAPRNRLNLALACTIHHPVPMRGRHARVRIGVDYTLDRTVRRSRIRTAEIWAVEVFRRRRRRQGGGGEEGDHEEEDEKQEAAQDAASSNTRDNGTASTKAAILKLVAAKQLGDVLGQTSVYCAAGDTYLDLKTWAATK
jgi:hypothetical protein